MSVLDNFLVIVAILGFVIAALIGNLVLNEVAGSDAFNSTAAGTNATQYLVKGQNVLQLFDVLLILLLFGTFIASIIGAFLIPSHPAFFIISFILMLILAAVTTVLSNIYYEFASTTQLAAVANNYPVMNFIFTNLPALFVLATFIIAIVMYGRSRGGGYGYGY